ncbi:hypothetical protein PUN28_019630 [Cardiocondyla obscurior]|uniref:Ribosomal protein S14 n=1 Tax=Cardiocondyla obscurior TaxID=286306 RepID=A0AAW2E9N9_9HYME
MASARRSFRKRERHKAFPRLPGNPPNTGNVAERERKRERAFRGIENNRGERQRGMERFRRFRVEEGARRRVSSGDLALSRGPVCFATRRGPACSTYISAKVGASFFSRHIISVGCYLARSRKLCREIVRTGSRGDEKWRR